MGAVQQISRRKFIVAVGAPLLTVGSATGQTVSGAPPSTGPAAEAQAEISPAEDLMREHGVLKRVLLVYREVVRRWDGGQAVPLGPLASAAGIIRSFIEDYHEKLEEDFLFPRYRKANRLVELVETLAEQHKAGRRLTEVAMRLSSAQALTRPEDGRVLADSLRRFIRMYEPHEAREDTVLFPAMRGIMSSQEYAALGEDFERKEHELFGAGGFETIVDRVADIEKTLGIYDLKQFTPEG